MIRPPYKSDLYVLVLVLVLVIAAFFVSGYLSLSAAFSAREPVEFPNSYTGNSAWQMDLHKGALLHVTVNASGLVHRGALVDERGLLVCIQEDFVTCYPSDAISIAVESAS